jgi:hypothetical protein
VIDIVSLANWIVHVTKFGFSGHEQTPAPSDALLARLNLDRSHLPRLMESVQRELDTTEDFVNVLEPSSE